MIYATFWYTLAHSIIVKSKFEPNSGGVTFFFSRPPAGLTNRIPVRDSRAGAPLALFTPSLRSQASFLLKHLVWLHDRPPSPRQFGTEYWVSIDFAHHDVLWNELESASVAKRQSPRCVMIKYPFSIVYVTSTYDFIPFSISFLHLISLKKQAMNRPWYYRMNMQVFVLSLFLRMRFNTMISFL